MAQQKNPSLLRKKQAQANNNPATSARMLPQLHSYTVSRPSQRGFGMANVLKKELQLQVIHPLVEGNSIRSIERLTGVQKKTIGRLLVKVGNACQALLDEHAR